jgi:hypothetical protein
MKQFVWIGLHESDTLLSQIYFIFLRVVMYGYLKYYLLIDHACRMSFFIVEVAMVRETEVEVIGTEVPRRPRFSIHFDVDSQELGQLFHARFFNWIGQGIVQPRPERPPFQSPQAHGILVPPHVSLQHEVPENDGWQEIVHPTVSQHRGWPNLSLSAPPPVNPISQASPDHSLVQSSHARKRLKTEAHHALDKGKSIACPFLTLQWL